MLDTAGLIRRKGTAKQFLQIAHRAGGDVVGQGE